MTRTVFKLRTYSRDHKHEVWNPIMTVKGLQTVASHIVIYKGKKYTVLTIEDHIITGGIERIVKIFV